MNKLFGLFGFFGLASAVLVSIVISGCTPPDDGDQLFRPPSKKKSITAVQHEKVLNKAGLTYYWNSKLELKGSERITRLYRIDETLYCMTDQNMVYAINAVNGLFKWSFQIANKRQTVFRPVHYNQLALPNVVGSYGTARTEQLYDAVLFNTLDRLVVIERSRGTLLKDFQLGFSANTGGVTDGLYYFVGGTNGKFYCVRIADEVRLWSLDLDYLGTITQEIATLSNRLKNATDDYIRNEIKVALIRAKKALDVAAKKSPYDMITAPLILFDDSLYIANESGRILSAKPRQLGGQKMWQFIAKGAFSAPFHVAKEGCFIGSYDKRLYGLNSYTGELLARWKNGPFIAKGPLKSQIQAGTNTLFTYAENDTFYAISVRDGTMNWSKPEGRLVMAIIEETVYLLDKDRNLLITDETSGKVKAQIPLTGMEVFVGNTLTPKEGEPKMYAASRDGKLFCITRVSQENLTVDMLKN